MSNLFISHSSRDNAAAKELQARLEEQGHRSVFLDLDPEAGIQAGVSWERTLYTKLRACRAVVALCSDSYLASQWCFAEIALARMEGKELFVLQIDPWSEQTQMPSILTEEQFIDLRTNKDDGYQRLWNGFKTKGIVAAEAREWKPDEPPYPGLRAFRESDAPIFFGRDEEIRAGCELLNRVRRQGHPRLVMVLGSSGSGKSSLVRAGVVPQLRRDSRQWLVVKPFRPGPQPTRELAASLSQAFEEAGQAFGWEEIHHWLEPASVDEPAPPVPEPPAIADAELTPAAARERLLQALIAMEGELSATDDQVANLVHQLKDQLDGEQSGTPPVSGSAPPPSVASPLAELASRLRLQSGFAEAAVVLVIDQFEELLDHDAEHPASRFAAMLRASMETEGSPLLVVGTMRSDYLGVLQRSVPFQGVGFKPLSVGPMSKAGMRQIIEEPARLGQIQLENGLADLLLEDTETAYALPLLAFTLRMMWDRYRDQHLLEIREYRELGGLQGAIAQVADEAFETTLEQVTDKAARESLERELRDAFLCMARPAAEGSGWSRQAVSWDQFSERVRPALGSFIDPHRLLVRRQDGTVEVAHEALFRSWNRLRGWLDENAEALHLLQEIEVEASKWNAAGADEKGEYLWSGGRLARAIELADGGVLAVKGLAGAFIEASDRAEKAQAEAEAARQRRELRRARLFALVVGIALLVAVGLWRVAVDQTDKARDAVRAATARSLLAEGEATAGNLMAVEIGKPGTTPTAIDVLHDALADPVEIARLEAYASVVTGAQWSPDGARVLSASQDRTARVSDAATGVDLASLTGHTNWVVAASFSPDGSRVVTASRDKTARIWNAATGEQIVELDGHEGTVAAADFSPDGSRVVTAADDGTARTWDAATGGTIAIFAPSGGREIRSAAFSPDGSRVATGALDGRMHVWSAETGEVNTTFESTVVLTVDSDPHARWVRSITFSADGQKLLSASNDGTARIWDAATGANIVAFEGHDGPVVSAVFSPNEQSVLTASDDGTARIWDAATGEEGFVMRGHTSKIRSALLSPDGLQVVTASEDRSARIWNAATGRLSTILKGHTSWVRSAAFSPDGERILTGSDDRTVRIWKPDRGEELAVLRGHSDGLYGVAFSPDGSQLVTASNDGTARIWDAATGVTTTVLSGHTDKVLFASFSPDGRQLVTSSADTSARIWDAATGSQTMSFDEHSRWIRTAFFSPDGTQVVTASDDGTARIWDAGTGKTEKVLDDETCERPGRGEKCQVFSAAFSHDGKRVVTASDDWQARIWNAVTGEKTTVLSGHTERLLFAAFSPDDSRVVTASKDHTARLWDAASGENVAVMKGHTDWVSQAAYSPDGTRIVTASDDGTGAVWTADGTMLFRLRGNISSVHAAAFSPDGSHIVTGADDGTARLWANPPEIWRFLQGRIRARTPLCLTADVYRQNLGVSDTQAAKSIAACERCVPVFFEQLNGASSMDGQAYVDAWDAYANCR